MKITVTPAAIKDALIISHEVFEDTRGFLMEVFRKDLFAQAGLPTEWVQINHARSAKGVLRGLHFQWEPPMGKMMRVTQGTAFLAAVDIRKGSPTLGKWFGMELSENDKRQIWAPAGFARGFCVLSDFAEIQYMCTGVYNPPCESAIRWDDGAIGIRWPIKEPRLSDRDANAQTLAQWLASERSDCFKYGD